MKNFISINFIYIRKINYLSQKDLGERFNISPQVIGSYERELSLPPITFLQSLCKEFNISLDDFVNVDLSKANNPYKLSKKENTLNESSKAYSLNLNEKVYEEMIRAKTETIAAKDVIIEEKERLIQRLLAILNQNGLDG